ncbi:MAG: aspartate kinase [Saprospirales bacterium]|jgi:aspartate kinase|nr:aspartate kinase [Saprospirales bacterium]MBK6904266.1 aspartate kinase [Saprospirales bacterium]
MKNLKVFKFGGSSVRDADNVKNSASIIVSFQNQPLLIVVSAMGKTTNALEEVVGAHAAKNGKALEILNAIKEQHYQIMSGLFEPGDEVYAAVNDHFVSVEWVLEEEPHPNYDYMYDQIICAGELVSSVILAAYLNRIGLKTAWLDARDVILTDDIYREGWVQWDETVERAKAKALPLLEKGNLVVTQGFIGSTRENATTTLGREGSDYTAAIFSFCLDAEEMTIWKDVPGVLTADPRLFENVEKLDRLSYREAIEMTYYGAKVIHPKTIKPLQNKSIPLRVRSFIDPKGEGTLISGDVEDNYPPMVAVERHQALVSISTRDFSFVAEHHMSVLFSHIADLRLQVNMMQNTAISFVVCVNDIDDKVERFAQSMQKDFKVLIDRNLELITVRHSLPTVLENLRKGKILLMEERTKDTVQMVVKNVQVLDWKGD